MATKVSFGGKTRAAAPTRPLSATRPVKVGAAKGSGGKPTGAQWGSIRDGGTYTPSNAPIPD